MYFPTICALLALTATARGIAIPETQSSPPDEASSQSQNVVPRDTSTIPRPVLGSVPYGVILNNCAIPGTVALTFDDGPSQYTSLLLDMLKAANVPATFFITGANGGKAAIDDPASGWADIIRRTYAEGHQIASHTWTHPYLEKISSAQRIQEMLRNEQAFASILGFIPTYMRPPYTFCSVASGCQADMAKLGYHIINLDLDTNDWQNQSPELIVNSQNTVANALNGGNPANSQYLLLEHDTHEQTVKTLVPFIIKTVRAKGYKFVRVGDCMNDPQVNWYRNITNGQAENPPVVIKNQVPVSTSTPAPPSTSSATTSSTSRPASRTTHATSSSTASSSSTSRASTSSSLSSSSSTTTALQSMSSTSASMTSTPLPTNGASSVAVNMVLFYAIYLLI